MNLNKKQIKTLMKLLESDNKCLEMVVESIEKTIENNIRHNKIKDIDKLESNLNKHTRIIKENLEMIEILKNEFEISEVIK